MDSKKIGGFIAERRKELNLTQLELANRLNITDRAISKWENGRGLPDISLIKPLCDELGITVNDLLSGEKLKENDIKVKSEENIISTLEHSKKKQKGYVKIAIAAIILVLIPIVSLFSMFIIDLNRMRNNEQVVFSTWGLKYSAPIDLSSENIEIAIKEYMSETYSKRFEDEKCFVASNIYLIEETLEKSEYGVYAWILSETNRLDENGNLEEVGAFSVPCKFIVKRDDNNYKVSDVIMPRDGSYYPKDMKRIFPAYVRYEMDQVHENGTVDRLMLDIDEQIKLFYHLEE